MTRTEVATSLHALAESDDLDQDGTRAWIRILTNSTSSASEVDVLSYEPADDPDVAENNVLTAISESGYRTVGTITSSPSGLIVSVVPDDWSEQ